MGNILLLGGSRFIGSNLAERLLKDDYKIIVLDMENANYANLKSIRDEVQIIKGDFCDSGFLNKIFKENSIDIVIHLVSTILPGTYLENVEIDINANLVSTIKLLEIMKKNGTEKIIFLSSGGTVYGKNGKVINKEDDETNPINLYGWMKLTIEKYIQMFSNFNNMDLIIRPSNPYGKNQNVYGNQGLVAVTLGKMIKNKKIEIWGDGEIIRDFIFIEDLCDVIALLLKKINGMKYIISVVGKV